MPARFCKVGDVVERIGFQQNEVRSSADGYGSELIIPSHESCRVDGSGADRLIRSQTCSDKSRNSWCSENPEGCSACLCPCQAAEAHTRSGRCCDGNIGSECLPP